MFALAPSVWPRFGGDQANRSRVSVPGPHTPPRWQTISLTNAAEPNQQELSSVIAMPDASLRVCHRGRLSAVTLDGTILWQRDLCQFVEKEASITPLCTGLASGETLHFLQGSVLTVDARGQTRVQADLPTYDGFCSPNLTYHGFPLTVSAVGRVSVLQSTGWQSVREDFGYDVATPAVYPDNSLAIAGYAGTGFCRVSLDGQLYWTTPLKDADLLPTINQAQIAAVGSLNDQVSAFFTPEGEQLGEYQHAATFAEYVDGGWIALSKHRLARLTVEGKELWSFPVNPMRSWSWGSHQPIVDRDGYLFVRQAQSFLCCDAQGTPVFEVPLPEAAELCFVSIIAPGVLAYVQQDALWLGSA